jgi:hypothetical protein
MGYVADAFSNLKSALEITPTEQQLASSRRQAIYDHLGAHWGISSAFLTGSYDRHTKTKKLKDVDIFAVIDPDGEQASLRQRGPAAVLGDLKDVLDKKYPGQVTVDVVACVISFGSEEIMSFEVVPAFDRAGGGYEIPDIATGGWIATDPTKHAEATTAKNAACDGKWVPFVKMVKGINRESGEPIDPSFLIEVMALDLIREPFGRYQDEIASFCASAAEQVTHDWDDPAGLGPAVNRTVSAWDRQQAASKFKAWQRTAEEAIDLEDGGSERAAVEKWRELFGNRMPRPSS